jgi:hypothetical protein
MRNEAVYAPIPLNLLFAWCRALWLWVRHDFYTREMAQREMGYAKGLLYSTAPRFRIGLRFRLGSFWIGFHWSPANRRLCINLIPCVTVWIVAPGGVLP